MPRVLAKAVLFSCALIASGSAPDEVNVRWSLEDGDLAVWKITYIPVEGVEERPILPRGRYLGLFGCQVDEKEGARHPTETVRDIPLDLALKIPRGRMEKGGVYRVTVRYDLLWGLVYEALVEGEVVKVADGKCRVRGAFSVSPVGGGRRAIGESFRGTLDTLFDGGRGVVETSSVRIQPQEGKKRRRKTGERSLPLLDQVQGVRLELKEIRRREPDRAWRDEIDESIRMGVVWLKKRYEDAKGRGRQKEMPKDGKRRGQGVPRPPGGHDCLAALTLLASGVPRDDPVVESLIEDIRKYDLRRTYDTSLGLMAMERYLREEPEVQRTRTRPGKKDLDWMKEMTRRLLENANRRSEGWDWGYGKGKGRGDLSNTQYAALGLFAAWRAGVEIGPEVWANLALGVLRYQCDGEPVPLHIVREGEEKPRTGKEGRQKTRERKRRPGEGSREREKVPARGFGYGAPGGAPYGSMTVAGIATLQIVIEVLDNEEGPRLSPKLDGRVRDAVLEGWAWMAENWLIQRNPGGLGSLGEAWPIYYLYGLERAGVLCRVHSVNGREWYAEGASWLVSTQEEDGRWSEVTHGGVKTCFALLFLKQSTRLEPGPVDPQKTRERHRPRTPEREKRSRKR